MSNKIQNLLLPKNAVFLFWEKAKVAYDKEKVKKILNFFSKPLPAFCRECVLDFLLLSYATNISYSLFLGIVHSHQRSIGCSIVCTLFFFIQRPISRCIFFSVNDLQICIPINKRQRKFYFCRHPPRHETSGKMCNAFIIELGCREKKREFSASDVINIRDLRRDLKSSVIN